MIFIKSSAWALDLAVCTTVRRVEGLRSRTIPGMKTIRLKPGKERSLQRRHPWIFESAIAKGSGDSGETVRVESHEGQFLAWAAFSPASRIRARVWSFDEAQRIDAPFFIPACARSISDRARFEALLANASDESLTAAHCPQLQGMTHLRLPQEKAMRQQQMTRLIHSLPQLTHYQRQQLASSLQALMDRSQASAIIEAHAGDGRACPHCASLRLVRNGSANGLQRFKCRQCARTFNALTGTPLARLHLRAKWMGQAQALGEGLSLNQAAQRLAVAQSTAFRWRHRFLACPRSLQARQLLGIAEADESYFLASCKGQRGLVRKARRRGGKALAGCRGSEYTPVLMARDRAGATASLILETNKAASVQAALKPLLAPDTVLCTDGSVTLASAARALGVQHQAVNVSRGRRVKGPWHVQNVNAYVSRLRGWLQRFKGVATKYLDSYLGWFRMLDRSGPTGLQPALVLGAAMGNQGVTSIR